MLVISGPTAGGKSGLALALAERLGGCIINADASQLYADLEVLTARPGPADRRRVPHLLYGEVDGAEVVTAADYAARARAAIADVQATGRLPVLVGGTGLYIEALLHGLAPVPAIADAVRAEVRALPAAAATAALAREDPVMAARLRPGDTARLHRALEVVRSTGVSLAEWQQRREGGIAGAMDVRGLVLMPARDVLHRAAEKRLEAMLAGGALDEVRRLAARGLPADRPVMKALGVPPLLAHLRGETGLEAARAATLHATRQYQKRQGTWARGRLTGWPVLAGNDPLDALAALSLLETRKD